MIQDSLVTLRTERLLLFALSRDQLIQALEDCEGLGKQMGINISDDVFSDESRQAMTIKMSRMYHADPALHPWYTYFLLVDGEKREAVGVCGFKGAPTSFGSVEVGYAMHEAFRNRGYMTEAVKALIDWAFLSESCRRVVAETLRDNFASQKVLQKAGMTLDRSSENMLFWKIDKPQTEKPQSKEA